LALSLPDGEIRDLVVTVTYIVVVFSILVQGLTLGPVIRAKAARAEIEMQRTELLEPQAQASDLVRETQPEATP
jgi:CPA1 family monovalent cation:H+ antiporter